MAVGYGEAAWPFLAGGAITGGCGLALERLTAGLQPFVERELKVQHAQLWFEQVKSALSDQQISDLFLNSDKQLENHVFNPCFQ